MSFFMTFSESIAEAAGNEKADVNDSSTASITTRDAPTPVEVTNKYDIDLISFPSRPFLKGFSSNYLVRFLFW